MRIEGKANRKLVHFKNLKIEIIKRQNYAQNETKKKKKKKSMLVLVLSFVITRDQ